MRAVLAVVACCFAGAVPAAAAGPSFGGCVPPPCNGMQMCPIGLTIVETVPVVDNGVVEDGEQARLVTTWRNQIPTTVGPITGHETTTSPITLLTPNTSYGSIPPCLPSVAFSLVLASGPRPSPHWDAVVTELLNTGDSHGWNVHIGPTFSDVPPATSGAYKFVETVVHKAITAGCSGGQYCPDAAVSRAQMAVFVLVAKEGAGYAPPACTTPVFNDVPAADPFCRWIEELARRGVVSGCGGGAFCPAAPVTREQMSVFLLRTLDPALSPPACGTPLFSDVPASSPFCSWIEEMARRGITAGCGGGNFCPTAPNTRAQMAVFLTSGFGLKLYGP